MQLNKKNIFYSSSKFYLLLLYIPFFIVQCFFNYDLQVNHHTQTVNTTFTAAIENQQKTPYFNTNKLPDKKAGIRLNKRFQPEDAPILVPPFFELSVYFTRANLFYTYPDPLFSSVHLLVNRLRGPPVTA